MHVVEISCKICHRLRMTPSTQFLTIFLAKNYLSYASNLKQENINKKYISVIVHASVLLAAKMRERDIYCPLIPDILIAGGM